MTVKLALLVAEPPGAVTLNAALKTLSLATLPAHATSLRAYRQAAGGQPELCGSSIGSLTRAFDAGARRDCSRIQVLLVTLYLALIAGVALLISGIVTKQQWGAETFWYVGMALFCIFVIFLYASYHIVAIPISGGTTYRGTFF